jgi:hypothetical protein
LSLPEPERKFLVDRCIDHQVVVDGGMTCVLFPGWVLPSGLSVATTDLLLRLAPGFPDVPPDMWWCDPAIFRADGAQVPGTQSSEVHLGRTWQRWSRHFTPGQWQAGRDSLEGFLALIRAEFELASRVQAA